jgi:ABC-type transport system involved in cytochrome c biogenesis permease subunit
MKPLLYAALAAYAVAAIHSILAFVGRRRAVERVTVASLAAGFLAHTGSIIVDWVRDGHYPLLHLYETISFLAWMIIVAYAVASYRFRVRALDLFVTPLVTLLLLVANFVRGSSAVTASRVAEGEAAWLFPVHTTLLISAYASFFVAFAASVMYLLQERELKHKTFGAAFHRLPSLSAVDDIGTTAASVGFTLLSLGLITGVAWSTARTGRVWHNDPIEFFALLTWVLYLALIHYRTQWRGRKAAWLGVAGFALVVCTFVGAMIMGGYHVFG